MGNAWADFSVWDIPIPNMGKGEHISMKTLLRICGALNCDIADVIALDQHGEGRTYQHENAAAYLRGAEL